MCFCLYRVRVLAEQNDQGSVARVIKSLSSDLYLLQPEMSKFVF